MHILPHLSFQTGQVTSHSGMCQPISILVSSCWSPLAFLYNFVWHSCSSW